MAEFITIEAIPENQQDSLQKLWDAVKTVFSERESIGYWGYPLFLKVANQRKSPDILIGDRHLGLIIIEVLDITIDQVISFNDGNLERENFDDNPILATQQYLETLKQYGDRETIINNKITGRSLLAFPHISTQQWQERGLIGLEDGSSLIFANQLGKVELRERIERASPHFVGMGMGNDEEWNSFLTVISGNLILRTSTPPVNHGDRQTRAQILTLAQEQIYHWDAQQEWIGKSIPPGPQRIRGIAGSGKTVLLCQKAALMHLKHPDWHIALVFFTRSLYDQIIDLISKWVHRFSNGEIRYNPEFSNLKVLHAWGAKDREGLYSYICKAHNQKPGTVENILFQNYGGRKHSILLPTIPVKKN